MKGKNMKTLDQSSSSLCRFSKTATHHLSSHLALRGITTLLMGSLLCCATTAAYADFAQNDRYDRQPSMDRSSDASSNGTIQSARKEVPNGWGIFLFGDFLYWRSNSENLYYGLQTLNNTGDNVLPFPQNDPTKGIVGNVSRIHP